MVPPDRSVKRHVLAAGTVKQSALATSECSIFVAGRSGPTSAGRVRREADMDPVLKKLSRTRSSDLSRDIIRETTANAGGK
jgi:hypothetical protein